MKPKRIQFTLADNLAGVGRAGQLVTMSLAPVDTYDPTELPTYLAGFKPFGFRADEMSPVVMVDQSKGKRRDFSSDDAFRRVDVKSSLQAGLPEVDPKSALTDYACVERVIGSYIPDQTESEAGPLYKPRQSAMRRCANAIGLDRELDVTALLTAAGSWNANNTVNLAAAFAWNGGATSDPIFDLETRIQASSQPVTGIWMNQRVGFAFLRHALVRDHMRQMLGDRGVDTATTTVADASASKLVDFVIPGLPPFHICASKVKNETTSLLDYVMGDQVVLVANPAGVPTDGEEIATSQTFRVRMGAGVGYEVREFRVEDRSARGGTMVVVYQSDIAVMPANTAGGRIGGVIV